MTDFLIYAEDKPDSLHIRQAARADHIAWLKAPSDVKLLTAGPWLDAQGDMRGSLVIVEADTQKTVEDWLATDPYKSAGLTTNVTVKPYIWAIGRPSSHN
ncbi:MAG: YciI family protein [Litorimonas sp.]